MLFLCSDKLYCSMKGFLLTVIFLPVFLFAQNREEFGVKKKHPPKLYYSTDSFTITYSGDLTYLWVTDSTACFYSSPKNPEEEYQRNITSRTRDSLWCTQYSSQKDTIIWMVFYELTEALPSRETFFFYSSGAKWTLRWDSYYMSVYDEKKEGPFIGYFTEFIPPKKK